MEMVTGSQTQICSKSGMLSAANNYQCVNIAKQKPPSQSQNSVQSHFSRLFSNDHEQPTGGCLECTDRSVLVARSRLHQQFFINHSQSQTGLRGRINLFRRRTKSWYRPAQGGFSKSYSAGKQTLKDTYHIVRRWVSTSSENRNGAAGYTEDASSAAARSLAGRTYGTFHSAGKSLKFVPSRAIASTANSTP